MSITTDNLHDWMHPALFKAINEIATPARPAIKIFEQTSNADIAEMLDLAAIYIGIGEFEMPKKGTLDYGKDHYALDHFYKD